MRIVSHHSLETVIQQNQGIRCLYYTKCKYLLPTNSRSANLLNVNSAHRSNYKRRVPAVFLPCRPPHVMADCICSSWRTSAGRRQQIPLDVCSSPGPSFSEDTTRQRSHFGKYLSGSLINDQPVTVHLTLMVPRSMGCLMMLW